MDTIYDRLRTWRWQQARELGVPGYIILPNDYLAGVASAMPTSLDQLSRCKGMGVKKLARFGPDLVEQVRLCLAEGLETGVDWPEPSESQEPQPPASSASREGLSEDPEKAESPPTLLPTGTHTAL